jgi:hypothetical protein
MGQVFRGVFSQALAILFFLTPLAYAQSQNPDAPLHQIAQINQNMNRYDQSLGGDIRPRFFYALASGSFGGLFLGGAGAEVGLWTDSWFMFSLVTGTAAGAFGGLILDSRTPARFFLARRVLNQVEELFRKALASPTPPTTDQMAEYKHMIEYLNERFHEGYFATSAHRWRLLSIYRLAHHLFPTTSLAPAIARFHVVDKIYRQAAHQGDLPILLKAKNVREALIHQLVEVEWAGQRSLTNTRQLTGRPLEELLDQIDLSLAVLQRDHAVLIDLGLSSDHPALAIIEVGAEGPRKIYLKEGFKLGIDRSLVGIHQQLTTEFAGFWLRPKSLHPNVWQYYQSAEAVPRFPEGTEVDISPHWPPQKNQIIKIKVTSDLSLKTGLLHHDLNTRSTYLKTKLVYKAAECAARVSSLLNKRADHRP